MAEPLLKVENLKVEFTNDEGRFNAVDGISFSVSQSEVLGIVGESGCGKSVTSLALMQLIQKPGRISDGKISFQGEELTQASDARLRQLRGEQIAMVFQEPMTALNPVFTVGAQIDEMIRVHSKGLSSAQVKDRTLQMLTKVGIPSPEKRYEQYPHELSGGMRQRVMIAMALSCNPRLLIADEPTTALDVTIQAQILDLMRTLQKATGTGMILITHDLGVVAEICHRVVVMYAGRIVEEGTTEDIFYRPAHPYTKGLLNSIPSMGSESEKGRNRLQTIPGMVPSPNRLPVGCRFQDRCARAKENCRQAEPPLIQMHATQKAACFYPIKEGENV